MSNSTSMSLLMRLREPRQDSAWARFSELYAPLIYYWSLGKGLSSTDAADLVQEVMTVLVVRLPEFKYDDKLRFRSWLKTITLNKTTDFLRRKAARPAIALADTLPPDSAANHVDLLEDAEYRSFVVHRALRLMRSEFRESTWRACWEHVVEERQASDVAAELGISVNAVYVAKSRVLKRLREELTGLLD